MHIIVTAHMNKSEQALVEAAKEAGIRIYGLNKYRTTPIAEEPSFLIGFGGLSVETIKIAVEKLMAAWGVERTTSN